MLWFCTSKLAVLIFCEQKPPGLRDQGGKIGPGLHVAFYVSAHRHQHLLIDTCSNSNTRMEMYEDVSAYVLGRCDTWYSVRTLAWFCPAVPSRKALSSGCGYDASWARMPVTSRLTAMVFSRRFSSRDNKTLMKGPEETWEKG